ncbi:MAG: histidine phosphatase family protein [Puniceicoccales bacterium]|jgi:phosphohistidine phosphatase SixA|nr:histidine phosphatase family protein [Puniceicoccales bacterium]
MQLFLLRHAEAESSSPDALRQLTPRGFAQIEVLVRMLDTAEFSAIAAIEHSPLIRAHQSAESFRLAAGLRQPLLECSYITPDDNPVFTARKILSGTGDRFFVTHNPHAEKLACLLIGQSGTGVHVSFPTASLMVLELLSPASTRFPCGEWILKAFFVPSI